MSRVCHERRCYTGEILASAFCLGFSSASQPPALPELARFLLAIFVDWLRRRTDKRQKDDLFVQILVEQAEGIHHAL
jgi:hypothetical protein